MYCTNCGKEVDNNLSQCPYCNTPVSMTKTENEENKGNLLGSNGILFSYTWSNILFFMEKHRTA